MMTKELLCGILASVSKKALMVKFHIVGEPLLNPNIHELIGIADDHGLYSSLSTNGTRISSKLVGELVTSGLDWISICLDGIENATYSLHRIGGNVDRVKEAIAVLTKEKHRRASCKPFVNVFVTTFRDVQPEIPRIEQFCREHGVDQLFLRADQWNVDGSHDNQVVSRPRRQCVFPWIWGLIDVDGGVYPCCHAFYSGYRKPYGNVRESDFASIWNNKLFRETRAYLSGKVPKDPNMELPCYNCDAFH